MLDTAWSDTKYAARALLKSPGFTLVAAGTLALGIGATTAIFSVVDHVLIRPLSYRNADRLYAVHEVVPKFAHVAPLLPVNAMHFGEWRTTVHAFDRAAMIGGEHWNLTGAGAPQRVTVARVSPALFPMLGLRARLGRTFLDSEDRPGRDRVVVLDDALWRERFGADPRVIGRTVRLDGIPFEVVGVLPRTFRFPKLNQLYALTIAEERPQIWKPFAVTDRERSEMGDFNYAGIVSLKPGISLSAALAELDAAQGRITSRLPERIELRAALVPLKTQVTGRSRTGLQVLLAAVAAVLLIGCVNIANLSIARATGRRRELAIRSALGAGPARLMGQTLSESLLLAVLGGVAGAALAFTAVDAVVRVAPVDLPRLDELRVDGRILIFTTAVSVLAGLLFGLLPAWRSTWTDPLDAMKASARGTTATGAGRLRASLVAIEVGLAVLCLTIGGLLLHSYVSLLGVDAGFDAQQVATVGLNLPDSQYPDVPRRAAFIRRVLESVRSLPGVTALGVVNQLPLGGEGGNNLIAPEGLTLPMMERPLADMRNVNRDYFETMGIPLLSGRIFDEADQDHEIAVISRSTAERLWPGQEAVGKRFRMGADDTPLVQVAGVVGDVHGISLAEAPRMTAYFPYWQRSRNSMALVIRTALGPDGIAPAVRAAIHAVDPQLPVPAFRTMREIVSSSVAQQRFQVLLVLLFGATAALLASLGIYGVVSYAVGHRTSELGIRMALGAQPRGLLALVVRQALIPVAAGAVGGLAAALAAGRLVSRLLYGVRPADPPTLVVVVALVALVGGLAAYLPARRVMRVDPVTALREE